MFTYATSFLTSFGSFSVAVDTSGAVVGSAFGDIEVLTKRIGYTSLVVDERRTRAAVREISDFLAGKRRDFTVPVAARGTEFQHKVWSELRAIPFGQTRSYGQIAKSLGSSARAVGRANATNPVCLLTPCHRVVGADGSLTGFAFGEDVKRRLLAIEGIRV